MEIIISEDHIKYILEYIDWVKISKSKMSESFVEQFKDKLDWSLVCDNTHFSEDFYEKYIQNVDWKILCRNRNFPEEFYERHLDNVHWLGLCARHDLSESFLERHLDLIKNQDYYWCLQNNPTISEEFKKKMILS